MNISIKKLSMHNMSESLFLKFSQIFGAFILLSSSANAAVWLIDPSVTLRHAYDDNYFLSSVSSLEDEVSTTTLNGELALRGKSERTEIETLLRLDKINYSGDDRNLEDRDNQVLGLSSSYRASEQNRLFFNARLFRDTLLRTEEILVSPEDVLNDDEVSIDPDDSDTDVNLVEVNVRRTRLRINPRWAHKFSERTNGNLNFGYNDVSYSSDRGASLREFHNSSVGGQLSHRITERTSINESVNASFFRPDGGDDVDTYQASVGLAHDYTETFRVDFSIGGRYSEFDSSDPNVKDDDSGFVANIGATKVTERTRYRINLQRNVNPSGSGNQVETDRLILRMIHSITPQLQFDINARAFKTDSTGGVNNNSDREYISIQPALRWQFLPSWNTALSYQYREQDRDNGGSGDSNSAFISFSYFPPRQF